MTECGILIARNDLDAGSSQRLHDGSDNIRPKFRIPDIVLPDSLEWSFLPIHLTLAQIGDPRACLEFGTWNLE